MARVLIEVLVTREHGNIYDVKKICNELNHSFLEWHAGKPIRNFFITNLKNSVGLAMNALNIMFVWIVSIAFLIIKKLGAQTKLK